MVATDANTTTTADVFGLVVPALVDPSDVGVVDVDGQGATPYAGVASAPALVLEWSADRAIAHIRNVRHQHTAACLRCRALTHVYTDGGTESAGLRITRRTATWFYSSTVAQRVVALPAACPSCGAARPYGDRPELRVSVASVRVTDMRGGALGAIRAAHPAAVAKADQRAVVWHPVTAPRAVTG